LKIAGKIILQMMDGSENPGGDKAVMRTQRAEKYFVTSPANRKKGSGWKVKA
jgi:hypothetical protein